MAATAAFSRGFMDAAASFYRKRVVSLSRSSTPGHEALFIRHIYYLLSNRFFLYFSIQVLFSVEVRKHLVVCPFISVVFFFSPLIVLSS